MLAQLSNKALAKLHVLVVDDDTLMQKLVKDVLLILGFIKITVVNKGEKAIEIIASEDVDLIICDWRMPGMSGIDLVKHVRNLPVCKNTFVSIIMLTGNAEKQNIIEARDVGITEYLIKPFSAKDLCTRIIEIIENPREFVISEKYKGPSRRRKESKIPIGIVDRRKERPKFDPNSIL
jgi:two-component system chemotaxis response regulator CheY